MDHDEVRNRFSELFDDGLSEGEIREIRKHLDECEQCRKEWEEFKETFESFRRVARTEAPPYLVERLKKRIHRRSRGRFFEPEPPLLFRVPYEVFSLIIIIIALLLFILLSGVYQISVDEMPKDAAAQEVEEVEEEDEGAPDPPARR